MSEVNLNLSDYKAPDVYFREVDRTITHEFVRPFVARLAVGFNGKGPFNRPVYIASTRDCDEILGSIDRRLERAGCFTNRAVRTMVKTAPVYLLNLLPSSYAQKAIGTAITDFAEELTAAKEESEKFTFANLHDRSRFWIPSGKALADSIPDGKKAFAFANEGTSNISLIVRRPERLDGYNATFLEWYGSEDNIPFNGMVDPEALVSDYFVQVIAVKGDWSNHASFANDPVLRGYFDKDGLKKEKVSNFLRSGHVTVLGDWVGSVLPEFYDMRGNCVSIDYLINSTTETTGLMFAASETILDGMDAFNGLGAYEKAKANNSEDVASNASKADDTDDENVEPTILSASGSTKYLSYTDATFNAAKMKDKVSGKTIPYKGIEYGHLQFITLEGLDVDAIAKPGKSVNLEKYVYDCYSILDQKHMHRALLNNDVIDFRYVVDTMAGGAGPYSDDEVSFNNCKEPLANLATDKQHCTALLNFPSLNYLAKNYGSFYNDPETGFFDATLIPEGGNASSTGSVDAFRLPEDSEVCKHTVYLLPYLKYKNGTQRILVPPAADSSNTFMQKFLGGDPFAVVANRDGVIDNPEVDGVEYILDREDRGAIDPFGLVPIIQRSGNTMIFGNKTAYQFVKSDNNYVHVRELLNTAELRCYEVLDKYMFRYNTSVTRGEVVSRIDPIFKAMVTSEVIGGYDIQVDGNNNPDEIIEKDFLIIDITIWVSHPAEKILTTLKLERKSKVNAV